MIRVTVVDTESLRETHISDVTRRLANDPIARVEFCNDYNRMIGCFINKVLGKNKKSMKDLDKGK